MHNQGRRRVAFVANIRLGDDLELPIEFEEGAIVEDVAYNFCKEHKLTVTYYDKIAQFIRQRLAESQTVDERESAYSKGYSSNPQEREVEDHREHGLGNYYSFGQREEMRPHYQHADLKEESQEQRPRLFQPVGRPHYGPNTNNDVLNYFSGNFENNLSTDRFLVEDLCKSINDSLDNKLRRLHRAPQTDSQDAIEKELHQQDNDKVFGRLHRDAQVRAVKKKSAGQNRPVSNSKVVHPGPKPQMGHRRQISVQATHKSPSHNKSNIASAAKARSNSIQIESLAARPYTIDSLSSTMKNRGNRPQEARSQKEVAFGRTMNAPFVDTRHHFVPSRSQSAGKQRVLSGDIRRHDQLHAMSKVIAERVETRKAAADHKFSFRPQLNNYQTEKTAMSFDERLEVDLKERSASREKVSRDHSREAFRRKMMPNTGRGPVVRRVVLVH